MDYKKQIKSPKWQKRRLEIMNRDNFTCQICGCTDKTLHVHHTTHVNGKSIWEYPDEMLITLCEDCHEFEHLRKETIDELIWNVNMRGVTKHEIYALLEAIYMKLSKGNHGVISQIAGEGWYPENERPYIKLLSERRSKIQKEARDGTDKDNKTEVL